MKKVSSLILFLFCILLFGNSNAIASDEWYTLWAGKYTNAGPIHVYTSGTNLKIDVFPMHGWKLAELSIAVHTAPGDIPQTGNGNPIPGHFAYNESFDPLIEPPAYAPYTIAFSMIGAGVGPGTTVYIAIHAVVVKTDEFGNIIENETGWGGPCGTTPPAWDPRTPLPSGYYPFAKGWGYYFEFVL